MGWGMRILAVIAMLVFLTLGAWPISLLIFMYLVYSLRRPKAKAALVQRQDVFQKPRRSWRRYVVGAFLILVSLVAAGSGGTYSPFALFGAGVAVIFWPYIGGARLFGRVVPVRDSILLRNRLVPLSWHALAEVKLESQDQTRGVASMGGKLLLFAGKAPAMFQVISVRALNYRQAEAGVLKKLKRETRMLSQRGAHLLPADSADAASRLSLDLERLSVGTEDFEAISSLPL